MSQHLGQNHGGYHGETIQLHSVLSAVRAAAERHGWQVENILADATRKIIGLHRPAAKPARRIYLSAGIHGDEPAGPLALRQLLDENLWPADADLWLCPCLNPTGFPLNRRENREGRDLNRDYRHLETAEVRAHIDWLKRQPAFDLTLCLHEDWESHGFYLYELNPDAQPSPARAMLAAAAAVCPIDPSPEIEGRPANAGLINPNLAPHSRPEWPEAFFLLQNKTRLSYTLEAPSDFPLPVRVAALVAATRAALGVTGSP